MTWVLLLTMLALVPNSFKVPLPWLDWKVTFMFLTRVVPSFQCTQPKTSMPLRHIHTHRDRRAKWLRTREPQPGFTTSGHAMSKQRHTSSSLHFVSV